MESTVRKRKPLAREAIMRRAAKASATKLAKRILKICKRCGTEWMEKPSHAWRQYCSRPCMSAGFTTTANFPCPDCGKSIIRRPCFAKRRCLECGHKRASELMISRGHTPMRFATVESEGVRRKIFSSAEYSAMVSKRFKGIPKTHERHRRFSRNHVRAVECFFKAPNNVVHYCRNISRFVHENQHLFNPADVIQKTHGGKPSRSYVCNATQGLARISRGANTTWKGWLLVSNRDGRERFDLIGKNFVTEPKTHNDNHSSNQPA